MRTLTNKASGVAPPGRSKVRWGKLRPAAIVGVAILAAAGILTCLALRNVDQPASSSATTATAPPRLARTEPPSARLRRERTNPAPREIALWEAQAPSQTRIVSPPQTAALPTSASETRRAGSTVEAQQLLARLSQFDFLGGSLTRSQAAELNQLLKQLVEQGEAAIPAIREFLGRADDVDFDAVSGGEFVNYPTLRLGLLDALSQIGGVAAVELSQQTLQATADPLEIALLTGTLEQLAPEQYRQDVLAAARNALALAARGELGGRDASPLFEVLQRFGDASVVPDLENAVSHWNYYATLALAGLPGGVGIPALIRLAQDPTVMALGNGDYALRALAQVAMQYSTARDALIEQVRSNQIPATAWPSVVAALAGVYIQYGNGIFGSTITAASWTPAQMNQRIVLIDQLMLITNDSAARQLLQNARASLIARLTK